MIDRHRKSIRLKNYDYTSAGYYFVTLCTERKVNLFGEVVDGIMLENNVGKMIDDCWTNIPSRFENVDVGQYQIMPNHIHGIVIINPVGAGLVPAQISPTIRANQTFANAMPTGIRATTRVAPTTATVLRATTRVAPTTIQTTLGNIIGAFKSLSTNEYIKGIKMHNWKMFDKRLWQRNYYERIIRNEIKFEKIKRYIVDNPLNWNKDKDNLDN